MTDEESRRPQGGGGGVMDKCSQCGVELGGWESVYGGLCHVCMGYKLDLENVAKKDNQIAALQAELAECKAELAEREEMLGLWRKFRGLISSFGSNWPEEERIKALKKKGEI